MKSQNQKQGNHFFQALERKKIIYEREGEKYKSQRSQDKKFSGGVINIMRQPVCQDVFWNQKISVDVCVKIYYIVFYISGYAGFFKKIIIDKMIIIKRIAEKKVIADKPRRSYGQSRAGQYKRVFYFFKHWFFFLKKNYQQRSGRGNNKLEIYQVSKTGDNSQIKSFIFEIFFQRDKSP